MSQYMENITKCRYIEMTVNLGKPEICKCYQMTGKCTTCNF